MEVPVELKSYIQGTIDRDDKAAFGEAFRAFETPETLTAFAEEKGIALTAAQAEQIVTQSQEVAKTELAARISDDELENVAGGISAMGVLAGIGAVAGAAVAISAVAFAAPALATAAAAGIVVSGFWSGAAASVITTAAAGGLSGAVWGGAIDAVWDRIKS
ncbi:hypothetical protein ACLBXM_03570 [Xanthobacteraceae bacterium A53D]